MQKNDFFKYTPSIWYNDIVIFHQISILPSYTPLTHLNAAGGFGAHRYSTRAVKDKRSETACFAMQSFSARGERKLTAHGYYSPLFVYILSFCCLGLVYSVWVFALSIPKLRRQPYTKPARQF